ncbi:MAG: CoA-binding protein [Elusimicrobia bacterium RIFOXYB2_FULL_48_7]|nr:MAG: CoA-binding protein [Elusimicrobia bacterium RIFOXYB2_FULL_48_7]
MNLEALIKEFISLKKFALVGATDRKEKFGYKILVSLVSRGYSVYPINPRLEEIEGHKCYKTLSDLPVKVDVVDLVVPPAVTEKVVEECYTLGLTRVWMQPGASSEKAIKYCDDNGIKVVHDACVMTSHPDE